MTVYDGAHAPHEPSVPTHAPTLARLSLWRTRHAATIVRAAAVFVPVVLVLETARGPREALAVASLITGIWLVALATTTRAMTVSPLVVGARSGLALGTLVGVGGVSALSFWIPSLHPGHRQLAFMAVGVFVLSSLAERVAMDVLTPRRRLLIVGSSSRATDLVHELASQRQLPFECVGVLDHVVSQSPNGAPPDPASASRVSPLTEAVRRDRPDVVVLADDPRAEDVNGLLDAGSLGLRVIGLTAFYEHAFGRVPIQTISPMWFMSVLHLYQRPYSRLTKRIFDVAFATVALAIAAPFMVVIAGLVYAFDRGPILYRQVRLGEGGRTFQMTKFRTMVVDAEQQGLAMWAKERDPRITTVGRILRKARLDELPQLWNVLRGDMSIVGPRPERPEFLQQLTNDVPFWGRRHLVKPGITGWAQVRHPYTSDITGTAQKLGYDLYYLKHRSLFLDAAIVVMTAKTIVSGSGAR